MEYKVKAELSDFEVLMELHDLPLKSIHIKSLNKDDNEPYILIICADWFSEHTNALDLIIDRLYEYISFSTRNKFIGLILSGTCLSLPINNDSILIADIRSIDDSEIYDWISRND